MDVMKIRGRSLYGRQGACDSVIHLLPHTGEAALPIWKLQPDCLQPARGVIPDGLAVITAVEQATYPGNSQAAGKSRNHHIRPGQKPDLHPSQVDPRSHKATEKTAVGNEAPLADVHQVGDATAIELTQVSYYVQDPGTHHGEDRRPYETGGHAIFGKPIRRAEAHHQIPPDHQRETEHHTIGIYGEIDAGDCKQHWIHV